MLSSHSRAGLLGLVVACAVVAAPLPPPALTYRFPEGEALKYEIGLKVAMTFNVVGFEFKADINQTLDTTWKGLAPEKGMARISQVVDRLRLTVDAPPPVGKGEYDSKDGKLPPGPVFEKMEPLLKAMVGDPIILGVTPAGKAKVLRRPEAMEKAKKALEDENAASGVKTEGLARLMAQGGLVLPNYIAGKGKDWEHTTVSTVPGGKVTTRTVYEHAGTEERGGKKLDVIRITPHVTFEPEGDKGGLKLKSSETSGKAYFDRAAGRLVETTVITKLDLEMDIKGVPVTQKIEQTMTMRLGK
jgi:hypothetical protein